MKVWQNKKIEYLILIGLSAAFLLLQFFMHRAQVFVNDDLWYATNLVTAEKVSSFQDILESQVWHFHNWGGRNITHGVLQAVETQGELFADIMNMIMTVFLSVMVCKVVGARKHSILAYALLSNVFLVSLNPAPHMNLFWQSGAVNYLYSTGWILLFFFLYQRQLVGETSPKDKSSFREIGLVIMVLLLGLMTGWSNENMGPASFVMAFIMIVLTYRKDKTRIRPWMIAGLISSLTGSILVVLAPGNFVRSSLIEETFWQAVGNHLAEMGRATFSYLFAAIIIAAVLTFVYVKVAKFSITLNQQLLLLFAILAHGAMLLSPTYPARATFGVLAILVCYVVSLLKGLEEAGYLRAWMKYGITLLGMASASATILQYLTFPPI